MTVDQVRTTPAAVEAARSRRADLHSALVQLEQALAAPAAGRGAEWLTGVFAALVRLREAFDEHVVGTESPDGLFAQVLRSQPRLGHAVDLLTTDHTVIRDAITDALAVVHELSERSPRAEEVREQLLDLVLALARHRQRGADLVYEAYAVDIGGSE
jgi:hypothetical protein